MASTEFFRRKNAAEYLRTHYGFGSYASLAKLAVLGGGPRFRKIGRIVIYDKNDLGSWVQSRISPLMHSTSNLPI